MSTSNFKIFRTANYAVNEFPYYIVYENQRFSYFDTSFINMGYITVDFIINCLVSEASKKRYEDLLFLIPYIESGYKYKLENALLRINGRKLYKRYEDRILSAIVLLDLKEE